MTRTGVLIFICLAAGGCSPGAFVLATGNSFSGTANRQSRDLLAELHTLDPDVATHACSALPYYGVWAHEAVPRVVDLGARLSRDPQPEDGWGAMGLAMTSSGYMTWAHPVLWVMASHPDPYRRQMATALMAGHGNHSILSVPRLCVSLMDSEPAVRQTATTVLGAYQYRALPAMPALMLSERSDPNPKVRRGAKYANYTIWKKGV